jgi:hypothetical protein
MGLTCSGKVVLYHVVMQMSSIILSRKLYQVSDMRQGSPCGWPIACTLNVVMWKFEAKAIVKTNSSQGDRMKSCVHEMLVSCRLRSVLVFNRRHHIDWTLRVASREC